MPFCTGLGTGPVMRPGSDSSIPACYLFVSACRHEHVTTIAVCLGHAQDIQQRADHLCAECLHCEQPHSCDLSWKFDPAPLRTRASS